MLGCGRIERAADGIDRQASFLRYLAGNAFRLLGGLLVSDFRCSILRHLNFTTHYKQFSVTPDMLVALFENTSTGWITAPGCAQAQQANLTKVWLEFGSQHATLPARPL